MNGPGQPGKNEGERAGLAGRVVPGSPSSPDLYAQVFRERYGVPPGTRLARDDQRLWVPWDEEPDEE